MLKVGLAVAAGFAISFITSSAYADPYPMVCCLRYPGRD